MQDKEDKEVRNQEQTAASSGQQAVDTDVSVEEQLEELRELLGRMQDPKIALEESFGLYARGMQLVRSCNARIDAVEKKVQQLGADGSLTDFEVLSGTDGDAGAGGESNTPQRSSEAGI